MEFPYIPSLCYGTIYVHLGQYFTFLCNDTFESDRRKVYSPAFHPHTLLHLYFIRLSIPPSNIHITLASVQVRVGVLKLPNIRAESTAPRPNVATRSPSRLMFHESSRNTRPFFSSLTLSFHSTYRLNKLPFYIKVQL